MEEWIKTFKDLQKPWIHTFLDCALFLIVPLMASFFNTSILKESSAITGKKKPERKARHLLADLPLPPELPGIAPGSPHSSPDDKKTPTSRKRPKYVVKQSLLQHLLRLATSSVVVLQNMWSTLRRDQGDGDRLGKAVRWQVWNHWDHWRRYLWTGVQSQGQRHW